MWSQCFRPLYVLLYAAVLSLFLWARRSPQALFPFIAVSSSAVITQLLKILCARSRPPQEWWLIPESGYAFPSGHATAAVSLALVLSYVVRGRSAPVVKVVAWLNAIGICGTRLFLGVHWFTDVLGGSLVAIVCGVLCWEAMKRLPASQLHL